jgi:hypothetical protein
MAAGLGNCGNDSARLHAAIIMASAAKSCRTAARP